MAAAEPAWWGWGDPERASGLSAELAGLLDGIFGSDRRPLERPRLAELDLPPSTLSPESAQLLAGAIGKENVRDDRETRVRHTRGKSTADLLKLRGGDATDAPDAVLLPGSHEQVLALLGICSEQRIAVVPFGGGTSVVGGLTAARGDFAAVVAIDMRRFDRLLELDQESQLAWLEAGLRGPAAERLLGAEGFTIGHFPQSFEQASIGGFAATRSAGQASSGYGRFDECVMAMRIATPRGTIELGRAPRSAAGPDMRQLFLGSEGCLGLITALAVELRRKPQALAYEGWRFDSFSSGQAALRALAQEALLPSVLRLADEAETALGHAQGGAGSEQVGGSLAIAGFEGSAEQVALRRAAVGERLRALGGECDADAGEAWRRGRFSAPYQRDALLDAGVLVETLETACFWSKLPGLYAAVSAALRRSLTAAGSPPVVLCHISHIYRSGASLYFTVACAMHDEPLAQWQAAKVAASDAILAAGGTISHHHGVGGDHRRWYERESGALAIAALRAIKRQLDPVGIMNPGVLI